MEITELCVSDLKISINNNSGCNGCKDFDTAIGNCKYNLKTRLLCDNETNNMWQWQHADRYEKLKEVQNEDNNANS